MSALDNKIHFVRGPDRVNFDHFFVENDVFQPKIIHFSQLMSIYKLFMEKSKHQLLVPYILIRTLLISFRLFETETVLHWLMS